MGKTLSHNASEIFKVLLNSTERVNSEYFEKSLKISDTKVRDCMNEIIDYCDSMGYDYAVGGGRDGYFITRTRDEFQEAIGMVHSREIKLYQRRRKLENIMARKFKNANQMSLSYDRE
jgi:hypothetical protein